MDQKLKKNITNLILVLLLPFIFMLVFFIIKQIDLNFTSDAQKFMYQKKSLKE